MLKTDREKQICNKYGAYDDTGHVHCSECPLCKSQGSYDFRCKANSHYNKHTKEWEYDVQEEKEPIFRRCPSCNVTQQEFNKYCPYCGQRIDWSKE